jgi:hypothetical protein
MFDFFKRLFGGGKSVESSANPIGDEKTKINIIIQDHHHSEMSNILKNRESKSYSKDQGMVTEDKRRW